MRQQCDQAVMGSSHYNFESMSKESAYRANSRKKISSDQQSVPDQWNSVQNRLDFLETTLVKLQKRTQKLQKKILSNEEEITMLKKECVQNNEEMKRGQSAQFLDKERELEMGNLRSQVQELHQFTKRLQKKSTEMFKELRSGHSMNGIEEIVEEQLGEKLEQKLEKHYKKNKHYIDQAVTELKQLIKQYVKDQAELENKITYSVNDVSRSNSKNKTANQRSSHSIKASQVKVEPLRQFTQTSFDDKSKCKSPKSIENNSSSRVSYLREKLKQFEEINKKYEDRTDKKGQPKEQEKFTIQKMKDFKNYLEQSESEIDQSNLEIKETNVLTDSIKKWRGDRFRYE